MNKSVSSFTSSVASKSSSMPHAGHEDASATQQSKSARRLARLGTAFLDTQLSLSQHASIAWPILLILWLLSTIQLLVAVPLRSMDNQPAMKPLMAVLGPIAFLPPQPGKKADIRGDVLFDVVASILGTAFLLHAWAVLDEYRGSRYKPAWRTRLVRTIYVVFFQAFLVTISSTLVSVYTCAAAESGAPANHWLDSSVECFTGPHLAYVVVASLLLPVFVCMTAIQLATMPDVMPDWSGKKNVFTAPHGRAETAAGLLKLFAGLWYVFGSSTNTFVFVIGSLLVSLALFAVYVYLLPFHHQWLNQVQCGLAGAYVVGAACAVFSAATKSEEANSTGAVAFFFMLPLAMHGGYACAAIRWRRIGDLVQRGLGVLSSPYIVELRVRWLLEHARNAVRYNHGTAHAFIDMEGIAPGGVGGCPPGDIAVSAEEAHAAAQKAAYDRMFKKKRSMLGQEAADDMIDEDEFKRHPSVLAADDIMKNAVVTFSTSAIMRLFASHYHGFVKGNKHLERLNLLLARQATDTSQSDVRVWCHSAMLRLSSDDEVTSATASSKMTVFKRMRFEHLQTQTRQRCLKGHQLITTFWLHLCDKQPDLPKLQSLGRRIIALINETQAMYRELSELAPSNIGVMRSYANFLLEIANDPKRGNELLVDAEQLEEENSKNPQQVDQDVMFNLPCTFDVSGENAGLMQASARPDTAGQILSMNAATLKMFGYNRREMIGRSIDVLVPEPISSVHSALVQKWITTGNDRLVNSGSRYLIGQHRAGHLFPIKANVRSAGDIFVVVCEEVITQTNLLMFGPAATGWRVYGACKSSMALLGLDAMTVKQGAATLKEFIAEPDEIVSKLDNVDLRSATLKVPETGAYTTSSSGRGGADADRTTDLPIVGRLQSLFIKVLGYPIYILRWRPSSHMTRNYRRRGKVAVGGKEEEEGVNDEEGEGLDSFADGSSEDAASGSGGSGSGPEDGGSDDGKGGSDLPAHRRRLDLPLRRTQAPTASLQQRKKQAIVTSELASEERPSGSEEAEDEGEAESRPLVQRLLAAGGDHGGSPKLDLLSASLASAVGSSGSVRAQQQPHQPPPPAAAAATATPAVGSGAPSTARSSLGERRKQSFQQRQAQASGGGANNSGSFRGRGGLASSSARSGSLAPADGAAAVITPGQVAIAVGGGSGGAADVDPAGASVGSTDLLQLTAASADAPATGGTGKGATPAGRTAGAGILSPSGELSSSKKARRGSGGISWAKHDDSGALTKSDPTLQGLEVDGAHAGTSRGAFGGDPPALSPRGGISGGDVTGSGSFRLGRGGSSKALSPTGDDIPSKVAAQKKEAAGGGGGGGGGAGPQQAGRAGSVGSRGSGHSAANSSVGQVSELLRRSVTGSHSSLERSLVILKRTVALVFVTTGLMNIASLAVTSVLFGVTLDNIMATIMSGERATYANRLVGSTQNLIFAAEGKFVDPDPSDDSNFSFTRLRLWADEFDTYHRQLYLSQDESNVEERQLNRDNAIELFDMIEGTYIGVDDWNASVRLTNLVNGGFELVSRSRQSLSLQPNEYWMNQSDVWWVMVNGNGNLRLALMHGLELANVRSEDHALSIELAALIILVAAEALILLLVLGILVPAVAKVQRTHHRVYATFLDTPLAIIRALRDISTNKAEAARRALSDDDFESGEAANLLEMQADPGAGGAGAGAGGVGGEATALDADGLASLTDDGADLAHSSLTAALEILKDNNRKAAARAAASAGDAEEQSWMAYTQALLCCGRGDSGGAYGSSATSTTSSSSSSKSGGGGKDKKERKQRQYRRNKSGVMWLLAQLVWPLLVLGAYFAGMYVLTVQMVEESRFIRAENLAIKYVQASIGIINTNLRSMYGYCDHDYITHSLTEYRKGLADLEVYYDALMLGDDDLKIRSGIRHFPRVAYIATQDGCPDTSGFYYTREQCQDYHFGIAVHGLQALMKEWINNARTLATQRSEVLDHMSECSESSMNNVDLEMVDHGRWNIIAGALNEIGNFYIDMAKTAFSNYGDMAVTLTAVSIIGTLLFYFLALGPLIGRTDAEIKGTRHLLLLLPDEVSRALPALNAIGRDMIKD